MNLFHSSEVFSLTDTFMYFLPKEGFTAKAAAAALQLMMSTTVWKKWFPTLGDEFKSH